MMLPAAECPSCGWRLEPQGSEPEEVVRVGVELEEHLARDHDMTWSRAREIAGSWLARAVARLQDKAS